MRRAKDDKRRQSVSPCPCSVSRCHRGVTTCHRDVTEMSPKCHRVSPRCHEVSRKCHENATRCHGHMTTRCHSPFSPRHRSPSRTAAPPPDRGLTTADTHTSDRPRRGRRRASQPVSGRVPLARLAASPGGHGCRGVTEVSRSVTEMSQRCHGDVTEMSRRCRQNVTKCHRCQLRSSRRHTDTDWRRLSY